MILVLLTGLTIGFAGDVNMGRTLGKMLLKDSTLYVFKNLDSLMSSTDLNVVNLEGVISEQNGVTMKGWFRFVAPPISVKSLKKGNIKVVSLANNHAVDFGRDALEDCFSILDREGILYVGAGEDYISSFFPVIVKKDGITVGMVAVTSVSNYMFRNADSSMLARPDTNILRKVISIMDTVDYRVILYHGDVEYSLLPSKRKERFARWCIDNGFDLFIGHHPHVPQTIEVYKGKFIFYSLGNFVFKQRRKNTDKGMFLIVKFEKDGILPILFPVKADYLPEPYRDVEEFIEEISKVSRGVKFLKYKEGYKVEGFRKSYN